MKPVRCRKNGCTSPYLFDDCDLSHIRRIISRNLSNVIQYFSGLQDFKNILNLGILRGFLSDHKLIAFFLKGNKELEEEA